MSLTVVLAEYQALKTEQTYRITVRDTSLVLTLTFIVGAFSAYLQASKGAREFLAIIIPFASAAAFWVYVTNDHFVTMIRRYIQGNLRNQAVEAAKLARNGNGVSSKAETTVPFGWEEWHRTGTSSRGWRKIIRVSVVALVFCGGSAIALALSAGELLLGQGVLAKVVWLLGFVLTAVTLIVNAITMDK